MAESVPTDYIVYFCLALSAVFAVSGAVIRWIRNAFFRRDPSQADPLGFSMENIDQLHQAGQISSDEYKMLRMNTMGLADGAGEVNSSLSQPLYGDDEDHGHGSAQIE